MSSTAPHRAIPTRPLPSNPGDSSAPGGWADTQPASVDPAEKDLGPFREALRGLQVRELPSDSLFQQFFGA